MQAILNMVIRPDWSWAQSESGLSTPLPSPLGLYQYCHVETGYVATDVLKLEIVEKGCMNRTHNVPKPICSQITINVFSSHPCVSIFEPMVAEVTNYYNHRSTDMVTHKWYVQY